MKLDTLVGNVLERVWVFQAGPVHPAWVDEHTTPINSWDSFLQLSGGSIVRLSPCEVEISSDRYPALGLELSSCTREAMIATYPNGQIVRPVEPPELMELLPAEIIAVEETDPLGEGTTTQYSLSIASCKIIFRHIMPPMSLGICIEAGGLGQP